MGVADTVVAMRSHRSYRPALGLEAAINEIVSHRGSLYDPDVVDASVAYCFSEASLSNPE